MADYDEATRFHLTPDGWVTGDRPANAVESWKRWSFRPRSGPSRENVGWTSLWADPNMPRHDRNALRKRYPELMGAAGEAGGVNTTIGDPI
jgi:hypothetical protein